MSQKPLLVIGVPTRDLSVFNAHCARGLQKLNFPPDFDYAIVLVENRRCPTGYAVALDIDIPLHLHHESTLGLSAARNRVLNEADALQANWLAFLDDDVVPTDNWLLEYARAISETPGGQFFCGQCWYQFPAGYSFAIERDADTLEGLRQQEMRMGGGNLLMGSTIFSEIGLGLRFDPRFDACGGEDTDFRRQAAASNVDLIPVSSAIVQETVSAKRATFAVSFRRKFDHGVSSMVMLKKYGSTGMVAVGMAIQLPRMFMRLLLAWLRAGLSALGIENSGGEALHRALAGTAQFLGTVAGLIGYHGSYYAEDRRLSDRSNE